MPLWAAVLRHWGQAVHGTVRSVVSEPEPILATLRNATEAAAWGLWHFRYGMVSLATKEL